MTKRIMLMALSLVSATACSGPSEHAPGEHNGAAHPEQTDYHEFSELFPLREGQSYIAMLSLTDTHKVVFVEDARGRVGIMEDFHIDLDAGRRSIRDVTGALSEDAPLRLAPAYRYIAGSELDLELLERLERVDAEQVELELANAALETGTAPEPELPSIEELDRAAAEREAPVEKNHYPTSTCNYDEFPSGWSWSDDGEALEDDYCWSGSSHCKFNMATTSSEWVRTTSKWVATGVAQDFCNIGRLRTYEFAQNTCIGSISEGVVSDNPINPRHTYTITWTVSTGGICYDRYYYYGKFTKKSGPYGSRGGLVVNPISALSPRQQCEQLFDGCSWSNDLGCICEAQQH